MEHNYYLDDLSPYVESLRESTCAVRSPWGLDQGRKPPPGDSRAEPWDQNFFEESPCRFWSKCESTQVKRLGEFRVSG